MVMEQRVVCRSCFSYLASFKNVNFVLISSLDPPDKELQKTLHQYAKEHLTISQRLECLEVDHGLHIKYVSESSFSGTQRLPHTLGNHISLNSTKNSRFLVSKSPLQRMLQLKPYLRRLQMTLHKEMVSE